MNETSLQHYLHKFSHLNRDSARPYPKVVLGRAPNKPILLLALLDMIAQGEITTNFIEPSPELVSLFAIYYVRIMPPDHRSTLIKPFFHLKAEGFWHLVAQPGKEDILSHTRTVNSFHQLHEMVLGAKLDDALFALLRIEESRNLLRAALIEANFAAEIHPALVAQGAINLEAYQYSRQVLWQSQQHKTVKDESEQSYQSEARSQGFRRAVISAYQHRCAFCGIRMQTPTGHTAVEAAHIQPWSESRNDAIQNGMALCRLCHWTFDEGLVAVKPDYCIHPSRHILSDPNLPGHFFTLKDRKIMGPDEKELWPDPDNLAWHLQKVFQRF